MDKVLSKEEQIHKILTDKGVLSICVYNAPLVQEHIIPSIKEYSKIQSIAFAEFIRIGFTVDELDDNFLWRNVVTNDMQDSDSRYTTEQLYELYLLSINKK